MLQQPRDSFNNFYLANTGDGAGWKLIPYDFNNAGASICYSEVCNERYVHWSIARPTCGALEENKLFGPLLTRPDWHQKYLEYVRQFVDNIMSNEEFLQETQEHAAAIDQYVRPDFYANWGQFYDEELSPDAANWKEDWRFPLLPFLKARAEDVKNQLDAIDAGTFKRGPHVGSLGDNEALEICPDWRSEEADRSKCHKQCYYEGCHMEGYTIESFCDEYTSKCLHGNEDERCGGIRDGETYPGFVGDGSGRIQYCKFAAGVPVLVTECGAEGSWNVDVPEQQEASGGLVLVNGNVFESVVISTAVLFVGFLYLA